MEKGTTSIDPVTVIDDTSIKPFRVDFQQEATDDLRRRIEMTRWASKRVCSLMSPHTSSSSLISRKRSAKVLSVRALALIMGRISPCVW